MSKANVTVIAGLLALAAVLGTVAAGRTVRLGASKSHAADAALTARVRQLDAYATSLRRALAARPPALPKMPKAPAAAPAAPAPAAQVVYRRPAPIVIVKHTHHGDDGAERPDAQGGGGDD